MKPKIGIVKMLVLIFLAISILWYNTYSQNINDTLFIILAEYKGKIEVLRNNKNVEVKKGLTLQENDIIITTQNSTATLLFQDGSKLTLSENTAVVINNLKVVQTSVFLKNGKLRVKVSPKQIGQVFEVKTAVSVASVRGTEFIISFVNNKSELVVIEGTVLYSDVLGNNIEVSEFESCYISEQGIIGEKIKFEQNKIDSLINEFETKEKVEKEKDIELLKSELKTFVSDVKLDNYFFTETILQVKESDFSTGRALVDIHGNLTQVEQIVSRNKGNSIEFINITKRDSYKYNGYFKDYKSQVESTKPRVDIFRLGIEFSDVLPEKISELSRYIANKGEDFYPTKLYFELSNLKDNLYSETIFTKTGTEKKEVHSETQIYIINAYGEKYTIDTNYDKNIKGNLPEGKSKKEYDGKLWFWTEGPMPVKEDINKDGVVNNKDILWLQIEGYLINNGNILTLFENSNKDPFTILKEVAVESIIFVRKYDAENNKPTEGFFKRNIDLVATSDIAIAMIKEISPSLINLKTE